MGLQNASTAFIGRFPPTSSPELLYTCSPAALLWPCQALGSHACCAASFHAFSVALKHMCTSDNEQLLGTPSGHQVLVLIKERPDGCLEALMHFVHLLLAGAVHLLHCTAAGTPLSAWGRVEHLLALDAVQRRHQSAADSCSSLVAGKLGLLLSMAYISVMTKNALAAGTIREHVVQCLC